MKNYLPIRIKNAWNTFLDKEKKDKKSFDLGYSYSYRPDRMRFSTTNESSILTSICSRIAIDAAAINIKEVQTDPDNGRYEYPVVSELNKRLLQDANVDQTGRAFRQDMVETLLEEGVIAIVPIDVSTNPNKTGSYDIYSMRVGTVVDWYPRHVKVNVYNDRTGIREDVVVPKNQVAIVENPMYRVMNEFNSTLKRLSEKLALLDGVDNSSISKLDLLIQFPYQIRTELKQKEALDRSAAITQQLKNSVHGIAYVDGNERITQLNRPVTNTLIDQVDKLTATLFNQLGVTEGVFNGTADEKVMLNYYNRTIDPIMVAITESMHRTFLTKTARTQGRSIMYFRDPFKLVPVNSLADIADKFTRNEILSSNDLRAILGYEPSMDERADALINKNINVGYPQPQEEY